ncbi:MAG: leucine-rich repeat protein [Oscillospiraceae bacterium]|nr:leucine-rich repeat protein [Oscillospiraceae bacterium]
MNEHDFIIEGTTLVKYTGHDAVVEIPGRVTEIGRKAFCGNLCLEEVYFPFTLNSIGSHAFEGCESLMRVELPGLIDCIDDYAFYRCSRLERIALPNSITRVGNYAFCECAGLTELSLPDSASLGFHAFYHTSINEIDVIDEAGIYDFIYDASAKKLLLSGSCDGFWYLTGDIEEIGEYAFAGCKAEEVGDGEKTIILPETVKKIGAYAFRETDMNRFIFPPEVKTIEEGTFANCRELTSVEIWTNVDKIHMNAFEGCEKLNKIAIAPYENEPAVIISGIAKELAAFVDKYRDKVFTLEEFVRLFLR